MRFLYFGSLFFFSSSGSQKLKKASVFFLIGFCSKVTKHFQNCEKTMRSEHMEMAFKERIHRIIEFPDTFLLVIYYSVYFSSIWPNFTEIGQIVVEL